MIEDYRYPRPYIFRPPPLSIPDNNRLWPPEGNPDPNLGNELVGFKWILCSGGRKSREGLKSNFIRWGAKIEL